MLGPLSAKENSGMSHMDCFIINGSQLLEGVGHYVIVADGLQWVYSFQFSSCCVQQTSSHVQLYLQTQKTTLFSPNWQWTFLWNSSHDPLHCTRDLVLCAAWNRKSAMASQSPFTSGTPTLILPLHSSIEGMPTRMTFIQIIIISVILMVIAVPNDKSWFSIEMLLLLVLLVLKIPSTSASSRRLSQGWHHCQDVYCGQRPYSTYCPSLQYLPNTFPSYMCDKIKYCESKDCRRVSKWKGMGLEDQTDEKCGYVKSGQRWTREEGRGLDKSLVWPELVATWIQWLRTMGIDPLHRFQSRGDRDRQEQE